MSEMPIFEAEGHLADLARQATDTGEVIYLTDHGRRVGAIVPADPDAALEALEDAADIAAADAAMDEIDAGAAPISSAEVWAEFGLTYDAS